MSIFLELKQQLLQQLSQLRPQKKLLELEASVIGVQESPNLLAWLKGQRHFPQMFWQDRDFDYAFAALGSCREYHRLDESQTAALHLRLPLVGGITFEGKSIFRLPRVMIMKIENDLNVSLFLDGSRFEQEREICLQLLEEFEKTAQLAQFPQTKHSENYACDFSRWQNNVTQALTQIHAGSLNKVVLANATTLEFAEPICAYSLLAKSEKQNQGCYHFLLAESSDSFFIGSSPECLYRRDGKNLHTEALAGTVAVSANSTETAANREWLLHDEKNIKENQWVVDGIHQQLADVSEQFTVDELSIKPLKNVQHLRRKIYALLKENVADADCLARMHPTAAVAGLPRAEAKAFITKHEPFQRGWYAGTFGIFDNDAATFCVALRSALVERNKITIYAGAGIVEGSTAEEEWQEIARKAQTMLNLLG